MKRIVSKLLLTPLIAMLALSAGAASMPTIASAQTPDVYLSTPVPGVMVDRGKQATFTIDVNNKSNSPKTVNLALTKSPDGWSPILKDRGFVVRSVWVDAGKTESVDLQITAPATAKGDNQFVLTATGDGVNSTLQLLVGVKDQTTQSSAMVVQYPTLTGKSGSQFGFKANLQNNSESDQTYGLSYKAPDGWDVIFKPSYQDTQISSVQVKSGSSQSLDINVTAPATVQAVDYPITVTASSASDRVSANLKVTVTGNYQMTISTRGDLYNTNATAGQTSPFYVTITNSGSAPLQNVSLSSSKPDGWEVTFQPGKIDQLAPGAQQEVAMMIKPSAKAIAGDYMLNVTASQPQVSVNRDIRVTVETPSLWGWIGVGILVIVIGGLMGMFMKLGRR